MINELTAFAHNPRHLFRHQNIFLVSHMRAYTSLFGHILGSHPQIEGYYEMHMGYFSWKSLWRQKLRYFAEHSVKPRSEYMFDKLLHNYCTIDPKLRDRNSSRFILMLRRPQSSIKSIVRLYQKNEPDHEFATVDGACTYYVGRVNEIGATAARLRKGFFYLDAECLVDDTDNALAALTRWLKLDSPLSPEYQVFEKTGKPQAGDSSEVLKSGGISRSRTSYDDIEISAQSLEAVTSSYDNCRHAILELKPDILVYNGHDRAAG